MEIDSMYSPVAKWDSRNTIKIHSRSYLMKKMAKFYQHFFSNVFNESTDTKTTVQTREKSLYSSYNLRRLPSFQKFTHFGIDRLEFLWLPLWLEKNVAFLKYINFIAILEQPEWMYVKFIFSKKDTKIDKIFTLDLTLCSKCQIDGEYFVSLCGLLRKHKL